MKTVELGWTNPTERESGQPLPPGSLKGTNIAISADGGATFTDMIFVPAPDSIHIVPDLAEGLWIFRFIWEDTSGRQSMPVTEPWDDTAPAVGTDVTVTVI